MYRPEIHSLPCTDMELGFKSSSLAPGLCLQPPRYTVYSWSTHLTLIYVTQSPISDSYFFIESNHVTWQHYDQTFVPA